MVHVRLCRKGWLCGTQYRAGGYLIIDGTKEHFDSNFMSHADAWL